MDIRPIKNDEEAPRGAAGDRGPVGSAEGRRKAIGSTCSPRSSRTMRIKMAGGGA